MNKKLIKEVKKSFKEHFKTKPLMVFSPGRINLIGEHTDFNDGFVFPAAINKGIALAINKSQAHMCRVYALNKDEIHEFTLTDIQPLENGSWKNYILGVVSEIQKKGHVLGTFNAVFAGNVPGEGLPYRGLRQVAYRDWQERRGLDQDGSRQRAVGLWF